MTPPTSVAARPMYNPYTASLVERIGTSSGMGHVAPLAAQFMATAGTSAPYYESALPRNLDIFSEVELGINDPSIRDDQRRLARKLLAELKANLLRNYRQSHMDLPYSKLHLSVLEDASVLIEWTYLNLRAGFSIEQRVDESSYYVLLRDREDGVSTIVPEYGPLSDDNLDYVASKVVARISEKL